MDHQQHSQTSLCDGKLQPVHAARIHAADLDIEQYSAGVNCGTADDRKAGIGLIQYLLRIHHSDREPDELFLASDERDTVHHVGNPESGTGEHDFCDEWRFHHHCPVAHTDYGYRLVYNFSYPAFGRRLYAD